MRIGIIAALALLSATAVPAQTKEADQAELGKAAWRCAYLAALQGEYSEARRLFLLGEQSYRASLSAVAEPMDYQKPPAEQEDKEVQPSDEQRRAIQAAMRRLDASHPEEWDGENRVSLSDDFLLGRRWNFIWRDVYSELFKTGDMEKAGKEAFRKENCAWIR
ncbi:hypothetical protein [Roseivivax marinus]|uniref:hypothetical protein n=1 Tax=Roseivivax marinus TaxID=1379903 RepID=UPI00273F3E67|nr:hypothetical protein [Roseivivax marinus]